MKLMTQKFGEIEVPDNKIITMIKPILGFESLTKFCLVENEEMLPFLWLQAIEEGSVSFIVVNPKVLVDDYNIEVNKIELAEKVYNLENSIGLVGGKQDPYVSALGGINFMEFKNDKVKVTRLNLKKELIKKLENSLILVYTGKPHFSGDANKAIMDNFKKGKNEKNLLEIKKIAIEMKNALLRGDLEKFAELMNRETDERKKLHKSIVPPKIEKIIQRGMKNGAIGAKVCGAGGGGSILFFGDKKKLKKEFKQKVIDFKFDFKGLRWL